MTKRTVACPNAERAGCPLPFLADILDAAAEAVFLLDADLRICWLNSRALALAGAPLPALLGQPIEELLETDALAPSPLR